MVIFHSYVSLPEGTHNSVPNPCCTLYRLYSETTSVDLTQAWNFGTSCQSLALPQAEIPMVYFWASKWPSSCTTDFIKATMLSPCWESCVRASSRLLPFRLEDGLSAGCWKSYLNSCYSQHIWMTDQGLWRKHCYWCWCVIYIESLRIFFPLWGSNLCQADITGHGFWGEGLVNPVNAHLQSAQPLEPHLLDLMVNFNSGIFDPRDSLRAAHSNMLRPITIAWLSSARTHGWGVWRRRLKVQVCSSGKWRQRLVHECCVIG